MVPAWRKKIDALLDAAKNEAALQALTSIVENTPGDLEAHHLINVTADRLGRPSPEAVKQVLALTVGTKPGGELTLAQRSRALALYRKCAAALSSAPASAKALTAIARDYDEAVKLRDLELFHFISKALAAWRKALEGDFAALVDFIREAPGTRADASLDGHPDFAGLGPVFEHPPFVEWLGRQPRKNKNPTFDEPLLVACGSKLFARLNPLGADTDAVGRPGRVLALLNLGANVKAVERDSKDTALHVLAAVGDARVIELLVECGAPVDARNASRATPLHHAAEQNRLAAAQKLIALGADVNARGEHRRTPAHDTRNAEVIRAVAAAGADFSLTDTSQRTPLDWAAEQGHVEVAEALGVLLKGQTKALAKASALAAKNGHSALAKKLGAVRSSSGVDVSAMLQAFDARAKPFAFFPQNEWALLRQRIEAFDLSQAPTWDDAVGSLDAPWWHALALTLLAREALPAERKSAAFKTGPRLIRGDLVVKGDLAVRGTLLVTGDLKVGGVLTDLGHDSLISVAGSLSARAVCTDGELSVAGDLTADQFVYGHFNDHSLVVLGTLRAPVVIEDQHSTEAGKVKAKHHANIDAFAADDPKWRKVFDPRAFSKHGLDRERLVALAKRDQNVFAARK